MEKAQRREGSVVGEKRKGMMEETRKRKICINTISTISKLSCRVLA